MCMFKKIEFFVLEVTVENRNVRRTYLAQEQHCVSHKLLYQAHQEANTELCLEEWANAQEGVMFKYWHGILLHQINTLMLFSV